MMCKALLLLLAAVLCGSLPAQDTEETARLLALFNSHPKADIAVELVKKYEGLHDRSDYPYYGYGHRGHPKSGLVRKLEAGNRDIYHEYTAYCRYKGKTVRSIERRRKMEFLLLYEP